MIRLSGIDAHSGIAIRERLARRLGRPSAAPHVRLVTCDRVECYRDDGLPGPVPAAVVRHLFRVAAGLESPLLGETQVLHQLRQAYAAAVAAGTVSPALHGLFQAALRVGKLVRAETGIARGAMSHAQVAAGIVLEWMRESPDARVAVIGVNRLNRNLLRFLVRRSAGTVLVGNRSLGRAMELATEFGCGAFPLAELPAVLVRTDILVSATAAPHRIVHRAQFPADRPMLVLDLAVPRDVEETVGLLPGVTLLNIEDIERRVAVNLAGRQRELAAADRLVERELQRYLERESRSGPRRPGRHALHRTEAMHVF